MYVCVSVCMYVYICVCVCMYVCMCVYMYACMCVCICNNTVSYCSTPFMTFKGISYVTQGTTDGSNVPIN